MVVFVFSDLIDDLLFLLLFVQIDVLVPLSLDHLAGVGLEDSDPVDMVILEASVIEASVREGDIAMAVFAVIVEVAFVLEPGGEEVELPVVGGLCRVGLEFVVKHSLPVELVVLPLSFVGQSVVSVVESAEAIHFVG